MAVQQLTTPILKPIAAFDALYDYAVDFIVIGGAQVLGNRLVIRENQTNQIIYDKIQTSMKLEHIIPAETLKNGGYYNAVVYTIDNGNNQSSPSTAIPFYCYSTPTLNITNIPSSEIIKNGTYTFQGAYAQAENEALNSYQFTLYDSNKEILNQTDLIYYQTDSSLAHTFVGMSNNTSYFIRLTGETINSTKIDTGFLPFTVRYIQPTTFAICDLVNDCDNGYIQISSNIVAIDGKSNPEPPIYIDDKEVDLRDKDSWVQWDEGFDIKNDFTMRAWGRDFNPYEPIITLSNKLNTDENYNKIEMKWMIGEAEKVSPNYRKASGYIVSLDDSKNEKIKDLSISGNSIQNTETGKLIGQGEEVVVNGLSDEYKQVEFNVGIDGNSEQQTYEGYNLLPNQTTNITRDGVTLTKNKDGSITLNGTSTKGFYFNIATNISFKAGTYTNSMNTIKNGMYFSYDNIDNTMLKYSVGRKRTFTLSQDTLYSRAFLWLDENVTFNNETFYFQTELGSTATDYEPYTGGQSSPNPDYPQNIEVIDTVNLFNPDVCKYDCIIKGDEITITKDTTDTYLFGSFNYIESNKFLTLKEGNYYITSTDSNIRVSIYGDYTTLDTNINNPRQVTQISNLAGIRVRSIDGTSLLNKKFKIQISKGTTSKPYLPYGCIGIEQEGKNKFYANFELGTIGNNGSNQNSTIRVRSSFNEVTEKTEYTISTSNNELNVVVYYYDKNGNFLSYIYGWKILPYSFTTPENCYKIRALFKNDTDTIKIEDITEIQLELGKTMSKYEPYHEPIIHPINLNGNSLAKVGNIFDVLNIYRSGKITLAKNIGKVVLDGNESIYDSSGTSSTIKQYNIRNYPKGLFENDTNYYVISNYFKSNKWDGSWLIDNCIVITNDGFVRIMNSENTTIEEFKNWLSIHKPKVIYLLKNPTTIELPSIKPIKTWEGTNIFSLITNLDTNMEITTITKPTIEYSSPVYTLGDHKNLVNIEDFNVTYEQKMFQSTNMNFKLKPGFIFSLAFNFDRNDTPVELFYSIGYGKNSYETDIKSLIRYENGMTNRNSTWFIVPEDIPEDMNLWVKFVETTNEVAINIDISDIQLQSGKFVNEYQDPKLYNIYITSTGKNIYNDETPIYLLSKNATYQEMINGYIIEPTIENEKAVLKVGYSNRLIGGNTYDISYLYTGDIGSFKLYTTDKNSYLINNEIEVNNGKFIAPMGIYDLQLEFGVDSSSLDNSVQIYNIQITDNKDIDYDSYIENKQNIVINDTLKAIGDFKDVICLKSFNILNPDTQIGLVTENTNYYLSQVGNNSYTIDYINEEGNIIISSNIESGMFTTPKTCVKIKLNNVTSDTLKNNRVQIVEGSSSSIYYPYVNNPSIIRYIKEINFTGDENWNLDETNNNIKQFSITLNDAIKNDDIKAVMSSNFEGVKWANSTTLDNVITVSGTQSKLRIISSRFNDVADLKQWLKEENDNGTPVIAIYILDEPIVEQLSEDNTNALKNLKTQDGISNVFTDNNVLGYLNFDYINDYTSQVAENSYILLKCWNMNNTMPYVIHSNYIDIPEDKDKVFIWLRRKNNLFDLKIENLGNYNEN